MTEDVVRPTSDNDREGWKKYWAAYEMPWRSEPEIRDDRKQFLARRREITPDIAKGLYAFRDENGPIKLDRADVEWLLATHMNGAWPGLWGRVTPGLPKQGIDLRGADLRGSNLRRLPLMQMRAGLDSIAWSRSSVTEREAASIHLEGADLHLANLQDAAMRDVHLEGANIENAHLEGTVLHAARLGGLIAQDEYGNLRHYPPATLRFSFMDFETNLRDIDLGNTACGHARLADIHWDGVDVTSVNWRTMESTGEEEQARKGRTVGPKRTSKSVRIEKYQLAARGYRQLSTVVRNQGLTEDADRFAYRAILCQRVALRDQYKYLRYLGSLFLDLISGYGYKPLRSVLTYLATIVGFAILYWCVTNDVSLTHGLFTHALVSFGMIPPPTPAYHLQGYEAAVVSITSFHGRGFFQPAQSPGDKVAILAALEAAIGFLIEIIFIATFTRRFFAR